jgi:hypothetical protein
MNIAIAIRNWMTPTTAWTTTYQSGSPVEVTGELQRRRPHAQQPGKIGTRMNQKAQRQRRTTARPSSVGYPTRLWPADLPDAVSASTDAGPGDVVLRVPPVAVEPPPELPPPRAF